MNKISIIEVDNNNINEFNKKIRNSIALVAFVAPWCGHCQNLHPKWLALENILNQYKSNKRFIMARVSEEYLDKVSVDANIEGFPTIRLFNNANKVEDYTGIREVDEIFKYIKKKIHIKKIHNSSIKKDTRKNKNKHGKSKLKNKSKIGGKKHKSNKYSKKNTTKKNKKTKNKKRMNKKQKTKKNKSMFNRLSIIHNLIKKS
tara:strand:- start:515 stop:1120 length:606 start_codon:yes stop_codon:yes gene_type:complete